MSLFQCEECGAKENTALAPGWLRKKVCSECSTGKWHGHFPKRYLPKSTFITNSEGNLQHKDTGETDISGYYIENPKI